MFNFECIKRKKKKYFLPTDKVEKIAVKNVKTSNYVKGEPQYIIESELDYRNLKIIKTKTLVSYIP